MDGKVLPHEKGKLFKHIEFYLKETMSKLYSRFLFKCDLMDVREISLVEWESVKTKEEATGSTIASSKMNQLQLPFYAKFIVIASYLASYNPSKVIQ